MNSRVHLTRAGGLIRRSSVSVAVDAPNLEFTSTVTLMYADYSTRSETYRDKIIIIIITHALALKHISWKIISNKILLYFPLRFLEYPVSSNFIPYETVAFPLCW